MNPWLAPVLAQVVTLSAGDRTEARVRIDESVVRYDAETLAWTSLRVNSRLSDLQLGYALLLSGLALGSDDREFAALHSEALGVSFRLKRTLIMLQQAGMYGEQNFRSLSVTPREALATERDTLAAPSAGGPPEPGPRAGLGGTTPPPETTPILIDEPVRVGTIVAGGGFSSLLSRRLTATGYVGYDYSGGLDELSQLVYPVFYGPFASLGASYRLSPTNGLSTYVTGRRSIDEEGQAALVVALEERWSHRFAPNLETELGLGFAAVESDIPAQGPSLPPYLPVGFAALAYRSRVAFEINITSATLIITPGLDRLTGIIDERAELRIEERWSDGDWDVVGSVTGSQSLSSAGFGLTSFGADGFALWHFTPHFGLEPGFRMFWQKYADLDPIFAYAIYAAFRVSTR